MLKNEIENIMKVCTMIFSSWSDFLIAVWGDWESWPSCPVACDGFQISRARQCVNSLDMSVVNDSACQNGPKTETMTCNPQPCDGSG